MATSNGKPPELWQFAFSHYNEKARWALDYKNVAHRRRSLLPGPHMRPVRRISGQTAVPVLIDDGTVVTGSAGIIEHLEARYPLPALVPASEPARSRALAVQRWFDEEVGPQVRCAMFYEVLPDTRFAAGLMAYGQSAWKASLYRLAFPGIRRVMMRSMRIDADSAQRGLARTREALDRIVEETAETGYFVGGTFSVADLTAAALLFPTTMPPQARVRPPEPISEGMRSWLARWADHPGTAWIRSVYRDHRGSPAAVIA